MLQKDAQKFPPSLIKFLYVLNKKTSWKASKSWNQLVRMMVVMIVVLSFIQLGLWSCFINIELLVLILTKKDATKNQLQICNEIYFIYFDFVKMIITMPTFIHVWWNWTVDWYWYDRQYLASKCSMRPLVLRTWSWNYELKKISIWWKYASLSKVHMSHLS